jgi:hypothetical protein
MHDLPTRIPAIFHKRYARRVLGVVLSFMYAPTTTALPALHHFFAACGCTVSLHYVPPFMHGGNGSIYSIVVMVDLGVGLYLG